MTSTASPDSSTSPTSPHVPTFPTKDYRPILKTTVEGEADKFTTVKQFAATDYDTQYATGRDKARNFGGGKIPKEVQPVVNMDNVYINFPPYWLYPDPDTFSSGEPPLTLSEKMSNLKKHVKWYYDEIPPVLEKGLMEYEQKGSFTFTRQPVNCIELIDIGTRSRRGDQTAQSKEFTFTSLQALALHLTGQRKREDAKKRFIYINACSSQEALVLYLGSPPSERYSTKGFIERYSSGTNWVKEDVFKTANLWVSELHLSFFVLVPSGQLARRDREDSLHQSLQRSRWSFASKRHDVSHSLRRAAISFRFVGDAYDKWWTCYTLSHIPHAGKWFDPNQYAYKDRADEKKRAQEDLHGQRRFLELVLMENITQAVLTDTSSILKFIDETLDQGESAGGGADKDSDIFDGELDAQKSHALSSEYVQFSKLLRIVQDNRRRMMETITEWNDREKQRRDQPRWSYEDEKEYRRPLDLKTRELKRNIARMKEQGDEIEWKLGDLKDSRAILSADLSLREARVSTQSSEDVRLFTYVTIIFLPLSFSSSLFSMQGLPENPVVNTFIILTTCALCITLLILVNLKTISRISGRVTAKVLTNVRQRMQTSFQDFWQRIARDLEIIEQRAIHQYGPAVTEEGSLEQRKPIDQSGTAGMARKRPYHQSKWWYLNFSFSYILLEMPARRVDSAWQVFALSKGQRTRLGSLRLAIRITIGLLWLPFLVSSHILSFTVINLWELPRLLYLQLSRGFHIFLQWLDEELPSEPQPIGENVSGGKDHGHSISRDQGRKTSVDNGVKGAASPSGQDSPQFSKASEERIKILSEPWKMSRAYPKWFKPKEDAGATESRAPMENNEDQNIDTRSEAPHGDRDKEKPDVRKWSPALKFLVSLLGRRKESQPQEANHGHNEGV